MTKTAVISGASSGVGRSIAEHLIRKGWVAIGLARNEENLVEVRNQLGDAFEFHAVDIADAKAVTDTFVKIANVHVKIDLLVNNAAVFRMARFEDCSVEDIDAMIDTNLKGTLYCTRAALRLLKRPGGRIINIASVAATHGIRNQAIYCASKYGVNGFAEALGQELLDEGIRVTTVCPGGIDTPLWDPERNPYPGDLKEILRIEDIVRIVEFAADLPDHVVMKKMIVFPGNEWH